MDPTRVPVETWLGQVEKMMTSSIKRKLLDSYERYGEIDRTEWVKTSFGQCVLTMSQVAWTYEVEDALNSDGNRGIKKFFALLPPTLQSSKQKTHTPRPAIDTSRK